MSRTILSATVGEGASELQFQPGINILWGQNAEDILLTVAGIFGGMPLKAFQAVLNWQTGVTFFVSGEDGQVFVNKIEKEQGDSAQWMKKFHKQRLGFWVVKVMRKIRGYIRICGDILKDGIGSFSADT